MKLFGISTHKRLFGGGVFFALAEIVSQFDSTRGDAKGLRNKIVMILMFITVG